MQPNIYESTGPVKNSFLYMNLTSLMGVFSLHLTTNVSKFSRSHRKHLCASLRRHEYVRQGRPNQIPDLCGPMLGADLSLAERDRDCIPAGIPMRGLPVGLTLFMDPIGGFRQVASGGADGNAVPLPPLRPFIEMDDIVASPVRVVALADDDVGRFDEGPFQASVALLDHPAVVGSASAGAEPGDQTTVAGEVLGAGKAVDGANFAVNDDGQYLGRSWNGLHELHGWCGLDALHDPILQLLDMVVEGIKDLQLLLDTAARLNRQLLQSVLKLGSPFGCEDVAGSVE